MKLYYFTNSYPFGIGEQWKHNELKVLVNYFDSVTVVPFSYAGNFNNPKPLPAGVKLEGPLFKDDALRVTKKDLFRILLHRKRVSFLKEFFSRKIYSNKNRFISWVSGTLNVIRLMQHPVIKKLVQAADKDTVFYFFWGKGSCEILPFIDHRRLRKTFIRMHRYDLFEYENNNYIPYREALMQSTAIIAPCSVIGKDHLNELYPNANAQVEVFRLGTKGNNKLSTPSKDGILRIVSCSLLSSVKRVHIMIESLQYIKIPVLWRHVGDGDLHDKLKSLAIKLGVQDKFIFEGMMDSRLIINYYTDNPFDLFVNVSASEGVPVSIMEAFSTGIPAIATNVGGTSEIVDKNVGMLLPGDVSPQQLAQKITDFYNLSTEHKQQMRQEAYNRYINIWNAEKLANKLAVFLQT